MTAGRPARAAKRARRKPVQLYQHDLPRYLQPLTEQDKIRAREARRAFRRETGIALLAPLAFFKAATEGRALKFPWGPPDGDPPIRSLHQAFIFMFLYELVRATLAAAYLKKLGRAGVAAIIKRLEKVRGELARIERPVRIVQNKGLFGRDSWDAAFQEFGSVAELFDTWLGRLHWWRRGPVRGRPRDLLSDFVVEFAALNQNSGRKGPITKRHVAMAMVGLGLWRPVSSTGEEENDEMSWQDLVASRTAKVNDIIRVHRLGQNRLAKGRRGLGLQWALAKQPAIVRLRKLFRVD